MNLFDYLELMNVTDTTGAMLGMGILCLFCVFMILKMLGGLIRGIRRQVGITLNTFVAAVISFFVAAFLSNCIIGGINVETLGDLLDFIESQSEGTGEFIRDILLIVNEQALEYTILLPAVIFVLPLLAAVLFFVLNFLLQTLRIIFGIFIKRKKAENKFERFGGVVLAVVQALIWITMITLPITTVTTLADDIFVEAVKNDEEGDVTLLYNEEVLPITQNPAVAFISEYGSEMVLDGIATVAINGRTTNLRDEILAVSRIIIYDVAELRDVNWKCPDQADRDAIDSILTELSESPYTSQVIVGVMCSLPSAIENNLFPINFGIGYENLLNEFVHYFAGITGESLSRDVATVMDVYYTICDSHVFEAIMEGNEFVDVIKQKRQEGDDVVANILDILGENPRSAPMITAVTEALITTLSSGETQNGATVSYTSLKSGMDDVILIKEANFETREIYLENLASALDALLRDHGIRLERAIVDSMARNIDANYGDNTELTDEEFNDILLYYYDAYLEYLDTTKPDEGAESLPEN